MQTEINKSGVKLWNEAKRLIPGGNQLLSKRAEMFLPDQWPAYYKKAKGVEVWDLDDEHYIDMSIMGIGTCILGYAHEDVNKAVIKAVEEGSMSTLNCFEEVQLAKKLVELHPWAQMVRFARTGGEACAIAVRIARAFSGKDKIAFCGYHGWHDWYLASNLSDNKNLDGQLLPGLEPRGVPGALVNTALPFSYGDLTALKELVSRNKGEIGVIITEVGRQKKVDVDFLKGVKAIAKETGAVLIFDEVSSGFRVMAGGMHLAHGINPDIVVLGKALGNGYPISTVIGKKEVMDAAQLSFISSTYWTERIGFVAALATIDIYQKEKVAQRLVMMGEYITQGLKKIFAKHSLKMDTGGLSAIPSIIIQEQDSLTLKTVFTQEMLKKGFLASNVIYVSHAHTKKIVDQYLEAADEVFGKIAKAVRSGTLKNLLEGPVCHSGFKRLT